MKDPIIDQVRRARDEYARTHHYDLDSICEALRKQQAQRGGQVVSLPPKKVQRAS